MSQGLLELKADQLNAELERVLLPQLVERLGVRRPGHCMRVSDLDPELMARLCGRIRAEVPGAEVVILDDGVSRGWPRDLLVSSTKLVELRNPLPDGQLRPPLLAFIPGDLRVAAEDSFGTATFEEIPVGDVYTRLLEELLRELPTTVRGAVTEIVRDLADAEDPWSFADALSLVRFLLTARANGMDAEAIGASLYEVGLVPDFHLLVDPVRAPARIARNRECVERLTWSERSERGRVLELRLGDPTLIKQLGNFLTETGVEDPRTWTRRIVMDRTCWGLAFNRWDFQDGAVAPDTICISNVTNDLMTVREDETDERLSHLIGQQVLPVGSIRKFSVNFHVDPVPSHVQGLAKFVLQVVSKEYGPVGMARSKAVWKSGTQEATVSFTNLGKVEWEEGWHYIRVLPYTETEDLVPLVDERGEPLAWATNAQDPSVIRPNESDLFYVLPEGDVEVTPAQRAIQREASSAHALFRLQFTALQDGRDPRAVRRSWVGWAERKGRMRGAGTELIEVRFGREGAWHVPVSRALKDIEQKILAQPDGHLSWRLPISVGEVGEAVGDAGEWPDLPAAAAFLAARSRYFAAVRAETSDMVTQGADLRLLKPVAVAYAHTYLQFIEDLANRVSPQGGSPATYADLRRVLGTDTITLALVDHRGRRREAAVVAPTHPLRALWLATWAELGEQWVHRAGRGPREFIVPTRDALLEYLTPMAFPPVLVTGTGRLFTSVDNLHPFWPLYASSQEADTRGLIGEICTAIGLPEPAIGGALIDGKYLAARVKRYLIQHPYVRTLVINAFNAGRAAVLADMLLELQGESAFTQLRYDIRLFVPDPDAPTVAEALAELLSPAASITTKHAGAFAVPTESHLRPKLRLAVRPIAEFRDEPERHAAHITLLFDTFRASEVGAAGASEREAAAPLHGLIQDFGIVYQEDDSVVAWKRQPLHGAALPIPGAEDMTALLSQLGRVLSSAAAAIATGQTGQDLRPVITLALGSEDRVLLHQVHEVSDWVMTIDRHMGSEFFDHGGRKERPDYLIDHSPDVAGHQGHRLVITSRSVAELEALVRPVLTDYQLPSERRHMVAVLDQLRSLSGRLALKLISAPTQRAEALGLALARMFLQHQGVFANQIVVPLDAHLDLYRVLRRNADELGDAVSFKRTDLALFDLDPRHRTITCRLVEVKCFSQVGDFSAFHQLKTSIAEQITQSEQVLSYHFDPHRSPTDRADRLMKSRELARLLEFYLERSVRYGIMEEGAKEEAQFLLRTLEDGYRLAFTRSALVFDFAKPGTEPAEVEDGVEYHRIGSDLIRQLVEAVAVVEAEPPVETTADRRQQPPVPTLDSAAFRGERRERTTSWEDLKAELLQRRESAFKKSVDCPTEPQPPQSTPGPAPQLPHPGPQPVQIAPEPSLPAPEAPQVAPQPHAPMYDVLLGVTGSSPQYGILGELSGRRVALDLNQTHTISLFGVQGGGKSYTLGTIAEMASLKIPQINCLPQPLATVIFHYSPTMDYRPEFTSMVAPNSDETQIKALRETYGAEPQGLSDVVLLVPADKLGERRAEYPGVAVYPLKFAAAELQASHWRFLMGAVGNQATYIRQLNRIMKSLRHGLTFGGLRDGIDSSDLSEHLKGMARMRLDLAAEYIDDSAQISDLARPGRLIIVDLRDEFIEKDEALGLFVVLLQLFADAKYQGESFNKLVVFDEAHKYIENPDLVAGLVEVVREMRHKGTSIMVASQDPPSVPVSLIELSSQIILHKFNSPAWLKHIQKANAALGTLTPDKMANLKPGEAYVWSSKATDDTFTHGAVKVKCRPRATQHGGDTKTAV
jgi:DNA phosphorothioation-dependent restriction protein DptH